MNIKKYSFIYLLFIIALTPYQFAFANDLIDKTFIEIVMPNKIYKNYYKEDLVALLKKYDIFETNKKVVEELRELENPPKLDIIFFQDYEPGESEPVWIAKFEISTSELGLEKSMEVVKEIALNFNEYIKNDNNFKK